MGLGRGTNKPHRDSLRNKMIFVALLVALGFATSTMVPNGMLSTGARLPLIGLGCSSGISEDFLNVVSAIKLGYTHLDTGRDGTWGYNERSVGKGIQSAGVAREKLFVQTKIHPEDLGTKATKRAFQAALARLRLTYVDSLLIHKPRCWEGACDREPEGTWQETWFGTFKELLSEGKAKHIGICDADDAILNEMKGGGLSPHLIQNWFDPFHQDRAMRERCKREGVQYQGYSTLGTQWVMRTGRNPVLTNKILVEIAYKHGVSVPQVVIQWAVRQGVAVLPASRSENHQLQNLKSMDAFELSEEDMARIDSLDGQNPEHDEV